MPPVWRHSIFLEYLWCREYGACTYNSHNDTIRVLLFDLSFAERRISFFEIQACLKRNLNIAPINRPALVSPKPAPSSANDVETSPRSTVERLASSIRSIISVSRGVHAQTHGDRRTEHRREHVSAKGEREREREDRSWRKWRKRRRGLQEG